MNRPSRADRYAGRHLHADGDGIRATNPRHCDRLIFFATDMDSLQLLVVLILCGGVVRWLMQLTTILRTRLAQPRFKQLLIDKTLLLRYIQATSALGMLMLLPVIARALASLEQPGSLAALNFFLSCSSKA